MGPYFRVFLGPGRGPGHARATPGPQGPKPVSPPPRPFGPWRFLVFPGFGRFSGVFGPFLGPYGAEPQTPSGGPLGPRGPSGPRGPFWPVLPVFASFLASFPGLRPGTWGFGLCFSPGPSRAPKGAKKGPFSGGFGACFGGSWRLFACFRLYSKVLWGPVFGPVLGRFSSGFRPFSASSARRADSLPTGYRVSGPFWPGFPGFWPFSAPFGASRPRPPFLGFTARSFRGLLALFRPFPPSRFWALKVALRAHWGPPWGPKCTTFGLFCRPPSGADKRGRPVAYLGALGPQMYHFWALLGTSRASGPESGGILQAFLAKREKPVESRLIWACGPKGAQKGPNPPKPPFSYISCRFFRPIFRKPRKSRAGRIVSLISAKPRN